MSTNANNQPAPTDRAKVAEELWDVAFEDWCSGGGELTSHERAIKTIAAILAREFAAKDEALAEASHEIARLKTANEHRIRIGNEQQQRADRAEAELARLKSENESLRTLWTEARDVVTQGRNANCVASYGKVQCDAVAAANTWLDKMPTSEQRTIDDASNAEWQLQRVLSERDQLRAEFEKLAITAAQTADRNTDLRAQLAAAQEDSKRLDWLTQSRRTLSEYDQRWDIEGNDNSHDSPRAAIDAVMNQKETTK